MIVRVFEGTINRMMNGYLLRDILNRVNNIHFTSKDAIHTPGHFYETMLREMRDAAGDSGEFYTPRPVVKFIVSVINPKLGDVVLDPAAGTGGFLVEAFEHLKKQCKKTEDYARLQRGTLYGRKPAQPDSAGSLREHSETLLLAWPAGSPFRLPQPSQSDTESSKPC